jgi:hypothetical protein
VTRRSGRVARLGLVALGLIGAGLAVADRASAAPPAAAAPAAAPAAVSRAAAKPGATDAGPTRFDHAAHAALKSPVAVERCNDCHRSGKDGVLTAPGGTGHQPCLASGCHVDDFLASGPRAAKDDPARHARATRFCRGCHGGPPGAAPSRAARPGLEGLWKDNRSPGHHIELDHLAHTARTACRSCHVVDPASFALVAAAPGHTQCAACHGTSQPDPDMNACQACHREPSPAAYFGPPRKGSDVRSCGSPNHLALSAESGAAVPCFKHERPEHRGGAAGALQCSACHFMIGDKAMWGKQPYRSLKDIKAAPVIHNDRDRAHQACGSAGCHARDVNDKHGTARCKLCHSNSIFE